MKTPGLIPFFVLIESWPGNPFGLYVVSPVRACSMALRSVSSIWPGLLNRASISFSASWMRPCILVGSVSKIVELYAVCHV